MAEPTRSEVISPRCVAAALLAPAAAIVFSAGLFAGRFLPSARSPAAPAAAPAAPVDPCALPGGIDFNALSAADRGVVARRALLCSDVYHERITPAEYKEGLRALAERPAPAPLEPAPTPEIAWAASVRGVSSQYGTDDWSANRVLGAPDVFPRSGDDGNAWASEGADDRVEFIEVGFDRARRLQGVDIFETYNPGAVTQVQLIRADGGPVTVYEGRAAAAAEPALRRQIDFSCTDFDVVGVRVTLDARAVPDWNEIDAIGARPCP